AFRPSKRIEGACGERSGAHAGRRVAVPPPIRRSPSASEIDEPECTKSSLLYAVQGGLRPEPEARERREAQCTSWSVQRPVMPPCPDLGSALFDVARDGPSA